MGISSLESQIPPSGEEEALVCKPHQLKFFFLRAGLAALLDVRTGLIRYFLGQLIDFPQILLAGLRKGAECETFTVIVAALIFLPQALVGFAPGFLLRYCWRLASKGCA